MPGKGVQLETEEPAETEHGMAVPVIGAGRNIDGIATGLRALAMTYLFFTFYNTEELPMRYGFGIDVGGTTIKLAFLDEDGNMTDKWEIPTRTEEGGKNVLPDIAASVKEYMEKENLTNDQIIGIGIGVPGPVSDAGIVNKCVNLGWGIIDLHSELSVLTGCCIKSICTKIFPKPRCNFVKQPVVR